MVFDEFVNWISSRVFLCPNGTVPSPANVYVLYNTFSLCVLIFMWMFTSKSNYFCFMIKPPVVYD